MDRELLRFEQFHLRDIADAQDLTPDEATFIYLYDAANNNYGTPGTSNGVESTINATLDKLSTCQTYVVHDSEDTIVGVAAVDPLADILWLEGIAVEPNCRSEGIGSFIIRRLVGLAREAECRKISGYAQPNSRTVKFYRHLGGYEDPTIATSTGTPYVPMSIDV